MDTRTLSFIVVAVACVSCPCATIAQKHIFAPDPQIRTIERLLPAGWRIVERHEAAVPQGLLNRETGYYLKLQGREKLYGRELLNGVPSRYYRGVEQVELWLMPPDFRPKKPNALQKGWPLAVMEDYTAVEASNARFKLFAVYSDTPSWPTWGKHVYRALDVVPAGHERLSIP